MRFGGTKNTRRKLIIMETLDRLSIIQKLGVFASELFLVNSLDGLAGVVETVIEELIPTEYTGLYLYDYDIKKLRLYYAKGFNKEELINADLSALDRHPGYVFKTKTVLDIPDTDLDNKISIDSPRSFKVGSRLYMPVMDQHECVGTIGVVSTQKNRFNNEDREILSFICSLTGLTYSKILINKQKQIVEQDLKLKERAIASSNSGIIITDSLAKDNPIKYVNLAFEKITGYSFDEVFGKNCRFLQDKNIEQENLKKLRNAIKENKECKVVLKNIKKDKTPFFTELSISPVFDDNGAITNFIGIQEDVTLRVETENALKLSRIRFQKYLHNLPLGILIEGSNREIIFLNQEFIKIFNIPLEIDQMIGMDCAVSMMQSKVLFKNERQFVTDIEETLSKRELVQNVEYELKDGRFLERDYVPVFLDGNYQGHMWVYRDVTNRKKNEAEISELKKFYEQTINDLPVQVAVLDKNFKYLYANRYSISNPELKEWIIGKDDYEYCKYRSLDINIAEKRRYTLLETQKNKSLFKFEEKFINAKGKTFHFLRVVSPVLDNNGEIEKYIAYGIDITERKNAEIQLGIIKNQLETILFTVGEGIITFDKNWTILMINEEVEKLFEHSKDSLINSNFKHLFTKANLQLNEFFAGINNDLLGKVIEIEGIKNDRSIFVLEMKIRETKIEGDIIYTVAMHDISQLKNTLKDLEKSNKALSEFAYIASHDLREPLRKISSFGTLLKLSLQEKITEDDKENLEFMIDGAKRMQQMIDDLLEYSRISNSVLELERFDLDQIVDDLINFELYMLIDETKTTINLQLKHKTIIASKNQIKQLLQNLITNAIKYRKPGVCPNIEISSEIKSKHLLVKITDNGIGIEEKYYNQIFEMFKRLNNRENYKGSGIGLAVCKKIIENHNGEIGVSSKLNEGTTFWFSLPNSKEGINNG